MLLPRLLHHDLHRAKAGLDAAPLILETPAKPGFLPAVVSTSDSGRFLVSRRLTKDGRLRSGVFAQDPDRVDDIVAPLLAAAYALSVEENYPNRFRTAKQAFDYVREQSGIPALPHVVLVPAGWLGDDIDGFFGKDHLSASLGNMYRKTCRIIPAPVEFPVFFSRPDFVGMYTQFLGGRASLVLHNVRNGLAFVPPAQEPKARAKDVRR